MRGGTAVDLLWRWFHREQQSKDVAKERLRLVLVHDRASVSPQIMQSIRNEIVQVISRYMDIDAERMEVEIANTPESVALTASIPVIRVRREDRR